MKSVLLYANDDSGFASRLDAAIDVARAFEAHLTCLYATPFNRFVVGDPFGGIYAMPDVVERLRDAEADHRARVEDRLKREGAAWDWLSFDGMPVPLLTVQSGLADLVVVSLAQGREEPDSPPASLPADVATTARTPVLAVPVGGKIDSQGVAVVAWNGAPEAAHALRSARSLLARASAVHILTVSDDSDGFPATDACRYLARHDIGSELHQWPRDDRPVAEVLLDASGSLGAAYLVAGAYGHSRLRQAVLGGVTRGLLASSQVPLLIAH